MGSYLKRLKKYYSDKLNLALFLVIIFLIVSFSVYYIYTVKRAQSIVVDLAYRQEEQAVFSGANATHVFLDMARSSLLLLSRNPAVINQDEGIQEALNHYVLDWSNSPVVGVVRIDKDGQINFIADNVSGKYQAAKGFLAKTRNYFSWAQNARLGEVYLDKPIYPEIEGMESTYLIPFVTPIFQNGEFDGVLVTAISLKRLTDTYIDPMRLSPNCRVYLFYPDGTILAGSDEYVGFNYFEYLEQNSYLGSNETLQKLKEVMESKDRGKMDIELFNVEEKRLIRFIIVYDSIVYNGQHLVYSLAIPYDEVVAYFNPLRENSKMIYYLFILTVLILTAMAILLIRIGQKRAFLDGIENGKKFKE